MDCYKMNIEQWAMLLESSIYFVNSFIAIDDSSSSIGNNVGAFIRAHI